MLATSEQSRLPGKSDLIALAVLGTAVAAIAWLGFQIYACLFVACAAVGLAVIKYPEIGILFFLSTFLFYYPPFLRGIGLITPNNLFGVVFVLMLADRILRKDGAWFLRVRQVQLLIGIGIIFLLSTLFSEASPDFVSTADRTRIALWDFYSQFAFLIFMIYFIQTRGQLRAVYILFLSAIILTALWTLLFVVLTGDSSRAMAQGGIKLAQNSNHLAFFCLFGIVFFYYLLQETKNRILKGSLSALMMLFFLLILLSASRNAFLNLFVFFGILTLEAGLELRKIVLILFLAGMVLLLSFFLVPKQYLDRFTALTMDPSQKEASGSLRERKDSLEVGLRMFLDSNPLIGVGPGNFRWIRLVRYDHKRVATHNAYLWALVSGGIPALVLYLFLFWTSWKDLCWMLRQKIDASAFLPAKWMIRGTRTILILFMAFSLFTESFLQIYTFLLVGATIVMKQVFLARNQIAGAS